MQVDLYHGNTFAQNAASFQCAADTIWLIISCLDRQMALFVLID